MKPTDIPSVEPLVDLGEPVVDLVEPFVDLIEPIADPAGKIVESLIGPPASLHGHPRIVAGVALSHGWREPAP